MQVKAEEFFLLSIMLDQAHLQKRGYHSHPIGEEHWEGSLAQHHPASDGHRQDLHPRLGETKIRVLSTMATKGEF